MSDVSLWHQVNRALVAKVIGELQYEECLQPVPSVDGYQLQLRSGARYDFCAWKTIWQQLRVNASSLRRDGVPVVDAGQFFIDAQTELQLDAIVLANLLEECAQTLAFLLPFTNPSLYSFFPSQTLNFIPSSLRFYFFTSSLYHLSSTFTVLFTFFFFRP